MDLDNYQGFENIDPEDMLGYINGLPQQLEDAWNLGMSQPLPAWDHLEQVVIAGMGGSAIGADLLAAYIMPDSSVPVYVHRDYDLPGWARGSKTLVISSSHSGNTEETLSSFQKAVDAGCRVLSISTGGKLADRSKEVGATLWTFTHHGQPRSAVGYSFGLLLAALTRLGLVADPSPDLQDALQAMRTQQERIRAEIPAVQNSAKRMAGQLLGRYVAVFASGVLAPVARRWKGQISEVAKAWSQFEVLPEADHNTLAGTLFPEDLIARTTALFLTAASDHPRNRLRSELTRKAFMLEGLSTDYVEAVGNTPLAHQWTSLHYGDYTAYYMAMAYEVDPTPVAALASFKEEMGRANA